METYQSESSTVPEINFDKKKEEIDKKIVKTMDECQEMWDILSSELRSCNGLMIKQMCVSDSFHDFHLIWRAIDFNQYFEGFLTYRQIDKEVFGLSAILDAFEKKTQQASKILREMTLALKEGLIKLYQVCTKCKKATILEELECLSIPDLTEIQNTPHPDLTELEEKWNQHNIGGKINQCIEELKVLQTRQRSAEPTL